MRKATWKERVVGFFLICPAIIGQYAPPLEYQFFMIDPEKCWRIFWHGEIED